MRAKKPTSLWAKVAAHLDPKQLAAILLALGGIITSQQQGAKLSARSGNTDMQVIALSQAVVMLEARVDSLTVAVRRAQRRGQTIAYAETDTVRVAAPGIVRRAWGVLTLPWRIIRGGNG